MAIRLKKRIVLFGILVFVTIISTGITVVCSTRETKKADTFSIVTSFYPVYIAVQNVVGDLDNVTVTSLTENQTGCLHDYQMTSNDMKQLETADIFIMNGAGMEGFIEEVVQTYPDLTVIDTSKGISLLENISKHTHDEKEQEDIHEDSHEEYNGHIWLNPNNYEIQISNIISGLSKADSTHREQYKRNGEIYISQIQQLKEQIRQELSDIKETKVIIFHDAFAYMAEAIGLEVVYAVDMDHETSLSAGEIAQVINEIKEHEIHVLLMEEQFEGHIANQISKETDANVTVINSLVTGDAQKDSYIRGMKYNIEVLKEALK